MLSSCPLSERICSGGPCRTNSLPSTCRTSWLLSLRFTWIARHVRLYSSITVSIRKARPSWVRSWTKS